MKISILCASLVIGLSSTALSDQPFDSTIVEVANVQTFGTLSYAVEVCPDFERVEPDFTWQFLHELTAVDNHDPDTLALVDHFRSQAEATVEKVGLPTLCASVLSSYGPDGDLIRGLVTTSFGANATPDDVDADTRELVETLALIQVTDKDCPGLSANWDSVAFAFGSYVDFEKVAQAPLQGIFVLATVYARIDLAAKGAPDFCGEMQHLFGPSGVLVPGMVDRVAEPN